MKKINKDLEFKSLYEKGLNDVEIGRILKISRTTCRNIRLQMNLKSNFQYKKSFDIDEFNKLYERGLNDTQIGKILRKSNAAMTAYRSSLGLKSNNYLYEDVSLSFEQEQVLIGGLLGDTHLRIDNINAYGYMTHGLKQTEYCYWKHSILEKFCAKEIKHTAQFHPKANKFYEKVVCRILTHPVFNEYYNLFYKNKVKYISKEMLYRLEELGLAVWFMDDGFKTKHAYYLSTNSFSQTDLNLIQEFFLEKFNIKTSVHKGNKLYIKAISASIFRRLIEPHVLKSLRYKL